LNIGSKQYASCILLTHITQVSPIDFQNMSNSDVGPILRMSAGQPSNIPTAETEILWMYISIKVTLVERDIF